jgi:hypothetical protein
MMWMLARVVQASALYGSTRKSKKQCEGMRVQLIPDDTPLRRWAGNSLQRVGGSPQSPPQAKHGGVLHCGFMVFLLDRILRLAPGILDFAFRLLSYAFDLEMHKMATLVLGASHHFVDRAFHSILIHRPAFREFNTCKAD